MGVWCAWAGVDFLAAVAHSGVLVTVRVDGTPFNCKWPCRVCPLNALKL